VDQGLVIRLSLAGGAAAIATLIAGRYLLARGFAALAVASVLVGWGAAAYPHLVPPGLTIEAAAGHSR
jgi:cytochrome d ubiquinol oxidase subunit II